MASLDKKFRPKTFKTFVGNKVLIARLNALLEDKPSFPSAMLFQGPRGCGKTTLARIIGKKLVVSEITELNLGNLRGIDNARNIEENVKYPSMDGKGKLIILDECHRGTVDFWNSMLKVTEEPPPNVYFILCTTNPEQLPTTMLSRTKPPFQVNKLVLEEMKYLINRVSRREKININSSVMRAITSAADGIPRDALLILNSIRSIKDSKTMISFIKDGSWDEENKEINQLCQALLKKFSYKETMNIVSKMEKGPEDIRRGVLNYMTKVLLGGDNERAALIIEYFADNYYNSGKAGLVYSVYMCLRS